MLGTARLAAHIVLQAVTLNCPLPSLREHAFLPRLRFLFALLIGWLALPAGWPAHWLADRAASLTGLLAGPLAARLVGLLIG
jgi:hypothetical protein